MPTLLKPYSSPAKRRARARGVIPQQGQRRRQVVPRREGALQSSRLVGVRVRVRVRVRVTVGVEVRGRVRGRVRVKARLF